MNDHLILPAERLAAKLTLEALSLGMLPHVGSQCRGRFVRFDAHRTVVFAHLGVLVLDVNLQALNRGVPRATDVTPVPVRVDFLVVGSMVGREEGTRTGGFRTFHVRVLFVGVGHRDVGCQLVRGAVDRFAESATQVALLSQLGFGLIRILGIFTVGKLLVEVQRLIALE